MTEVSSGLDQLPAGWSSAPIAREFVHRRAISEVFLTGIHGSGDVMYSVGAQWPRWHVFYGARQDRFDSAIVVETLRQLTVFTAHSELGVPLGMQFLMPELSVSMAFGATRDPSCPVDVTIEVLISEVKALRHGIVAFRSTATFTVDGRKIAEGTASARIIAPEAYLRIRARRRVADGHDEITPVLADEVGHASSWNVVLGKSGSVGSWPLRVYTSNPILFDHPLDHIPGVLLIEAVRQALRLSFHDPGLDFGTLDAEFMSIAEFNQETAVVLESLTSEKDLTMAEVQIHAGGKVLMRALVGIRTMASLLPIAELETQ